MPYGGSWVFWLPCCVCVGSEAHLVKTHICWACSSMATLSYDLYTPEQQADKDPIVETTSSHVCECVNVCCELCVVHLVMAWSAFLPGSMHIGDSFCGARQLPDHFSLVTFPWSLLLGHSSLVTFSLVTSPWSILLDHFSLVTPPWSLFLGHFSLVHISLATSPWSLLLGSLFLGHFSLLTSPWPLLLGAGRQPRRMSSLAGLPSAVAQTETQPMVLDHRLTRLVWTLNNPMCPGGSGHVHLT